VLGGGCNVLYAFIWSFGITMYSIKFGRYPILRRTPYNGSLYIPENCHSDFEKLIALMLMRNSEERIDIEQIPLHDYFDQKIRKNFPNLKRKISLNSINQLFHNKENSLKFCPQNKSCPTLYTLPETVTTIISDH
jgi:serine/threonine protein kinase